MIPVKLYLRNFMSYGEAGEELDFDFHTACLCGDNGNGKSALLDALTWALWGKAPRLEGTQSKADEIIRRGEGVNEALVELQFTVNGESYRITRRLRRGRGATLELNLADNGEWRPLTGPKLSDTQGLVQSLLGLDYHAFVMSSFLFQGKADSFTRAAPTERKEVLGRILRLDVYDELAKRARDAARECAGRAQQLEQEIARLEAQAARAPELEAQAHESAAALAAAEADLGRHEADLDAARRRHVAAETATRELQRTAARLEQARGQVETASRQAEVLGRRITAQQAVLAQEPAARAAVTRLDELRKSDDELNARRDQAAGAETARQQALAALRTEQARIETELRQVEAALAEARSSASQAEKVARELAQLEEQIQACRQAEAALESSRDELQRLQAGQAADAQAEKALRSELAEIAERVAALAAASARCPLCEQALDDDLRGRLVAEARALSDTKQSSLAKLAQAGQATAQVLAQTQARMRELQPQIAGAGKLQRQLGEAQRRREEAQAAAVKVEQLAARARERGESLSGNAFAPEERTRLREAEARLAEIAYDAAEHRRVQAEMRGLAGCEKRLGEIESARAALPQDEAHLAQAQAGIAAAQETLAAVEAERAELAQQAADLAPAATALAAAQAQRAATDRERQRRAAEVATLQAQIAACATAARDAAARRGERDAAAHDRVLYGELAEAFGRQGVQALVVETVLPQLTQDANELLGRMTEGRMQVTFVTQRERPDGGAAETLDLHIADEMGTRRYELYSGGEAFRVDFAVRVALARLLAHRAGARLQTLVIDEGFGTQDTQSRDRLVECINAIQGDFEKVLIVTHIEELKDAFQERIEVTKDETGSHIRRPGALDAAAA